MKDATFVLFDKDGKELVRIIKTHNYQRYSMLCAARQKFLDSLYRPEAVQAEIVSVDGKVVNKFTFDADGRSQHQFEG